MTVAELIKLLKRCPQDALVMYDIEHELWNETIKIVHDDKYDTPYLENCFPIDDAMVGSGTLKGFVYLTADRID